MKRFRNVLLAIDVMGEGFHEDEEIPARVHAAAREARWLVESIGARLTVITVVEAADRPDVREAALTLLEHGTRAELEAVPCERHVAFGTPFVEIIRHVRRQSVDLVILAGRRPTLLDRAILGSTALRLLRKCPCAVWVTGRHPVPGPWTVLTAVGSTGLAPTLLEISAEIVRLRGGEWNVLHTAEYPEEAGLRLRHRPQGEIDAHRQTVREADWSTLQSMTRELGDGAGLAPKLWLAEGRPDEQIRRVIDEQDVHLVVMGSLGRSGLPGVLIGNVAERVFKSVECSVLAIKPAGFASPLDEEG